MMVPSGGSVFSNSSAHIREALLSLWGLGFTVYGLQCSKDPDIEVRGAAGRIGAEAEGLTWRPRGLSKSMISYNRAIGVTPFRVLIILLINLLIKFFWASMYRASTGISEIRSHFWMAVAPFTLCHDTAASVKICNPGKRRCIHEMAESNSTTMNQTAGNNFTSNNEPAMITNLLKSETL